MIRSLVRGPNHSGTDGPLPVSQEPRDWERWWPRVKCKAFQDLASGESHKLTPGGVGGEGSEGTEKGMGGDEGGIKVE